MSDTFFVYSLKLAAYLILKNQKPYKIKTDEDGKFLFFFPNKERCETILNEYRGLRWG